MSYDPIKKRHRKATEKVRNILILSGYEVYFTGAPFDLLADSGDSSKRIKVVLGKASLEDVRAVGRAPVPPHTYREIWQITDDDRKFDIRRVK